jgi:DNA-binding protein H-NS
MALDLAGLSPKELDALISQAKQRKQTLSKRSPIADVRKALVATAKKHGWTLEEALGGGKAAPTAASGKGKKTPAAKSRRSAMKGSKVAAKYRHPGTGETWSGRGIVPKWMAAEIAQGKKRDDFLI